MIALRLAALAGALVGLGAFTVVWAVLPTAPIDLTASLARFDRPALALPAPGAAGLWRRLVALLADRAATRSGWLLGAPMRDLAVLGRPVQRFIGQRLSLAGLGLALPGLLWVFCRIIDFGVPIVVPVFVGVGAAVALSLVPAMAVREDATEARTEFRAATSAYLDLVAQERASGRSPTQALLEAAQVGNGWVFATIRDRLVQAPRLGITPWQALAALADQIDVTELADLADIVASAADGAAVYTTLTKKSASLRAATLAAEQAEANARSERLVLPVALLTGGFILLVFYPAVVAILTT